jgi:hypothetical protein
VFKPLSEHTQGAVVFDREADAHHTYSTTGKIEEWTSRLKPRPPAAEGARILRRMRTLTIADPACPAARTCRSSPVFRASSSSAVRHHPCKTTMYDAAHAAGTALRPAGDI